MIARGALPLLTVVFASCAFAQFLNFAGSCSAWQLESDQHTLTGVCVDGNGTPHVSHLDLDTCVGNNNGILGVGANYQGTCSNCDIACKQTFLQCTCGNLASSTNTSKVDLDAIVGNAQGSLACH